MFFFESKQYKQELRDKLENYQINLCYKIMDKYTGDSRLFKQFQANDKFSRYLNRINKVDGTGVEAFKELHKIELRMEIIDI